MKLSSYASKIGRFTLVGLMLTSLFVIAPAQLRLPSPKQALSSPGMEKMAGILFSRRFESGSIMGKPNILPTSDPQTKRVQKIVSNLAKSVAMDRPNVVFQAKVVEGDEVNAFCIPGGYIYVYTGLIKHIDANHPNEPDDALAAVLGHEIAHAVLRHGLKDWAQSKQFDKVLDDPEVFQKVLMASSREQELEADRYGALYLLRAGYKVTAAGHVFEKFPRSRQIYDRGLSTHPSGEERVAQLKKFVKQMRTTIGLWDEAFKASNAGRFDQASVALEILEAEFPNLPSVHNNLGWVYYRLYEESDPTPLKEHPAYSFVSDLGLSVRAVDGDLVFLNEAQDSFRKALQLNPDMVEAYEGAALCALEADLYQDAATALNKALELKPNRPETLNLLGILEGRQGTQQQAATYYQKSLAANPNFAPARFNLGQAQLAMGKKSEGEAELKKYLALEKSGHWADQAAKSLGQTLASEKAKKPQQLAKVRLGQPRDMVIDALGAPQSSQQTQTDFERLEYPNSGLTVWLEQGEVQMIASRQGAPKDLNLKLGQSAEDVQAVLGRPVKKSMAEGELYWSYPGQGLGVSLRDGKVVGFTLAER